ncbi:MULTISPECIES: putative nucleotide-diphospho-sugar transferase [unclassified Achromobacter]|uniref:putative nucleotide-diphospho-sugar transferase n=1 Tax=unclassified Achromobacter TaxID=2626865 RepID=UPI001E532CFE|nr:MULTISPECIES: putative nucleotide-diphospho-sugar transferase [unclassified Achromobacter]
MWRRLQRKLSAWTPEHQRVAVDFPDARELRRRSARAGQPQGMIAGFYTRDSIYEAEKNRFVRSAQLIGLPADVVQVSSTGSWVRNAAMKPGVLATLRARHRGALLYVDVDAVFHRDPWPVLLDLDCDIAAYYEPEGHLLSGTLLINDTPAAAALLDAWRLACAADPQAWDQVVLERLIAEDAARAQPRYRLARLPVSFCWIFDKTNNEACDAVFIEHLQASREAKRRKRLFGRPGKALRRRRERTLAIERILFDQDGYPGGEKQDARHTVDSRYARPASH